MSVKYWKLPSWADPRRALTVLSEAAHESGIAEVVKERMCEIERSKPEKVDLPGFHLFDRSGHISPYSWLVPKPRGDFQDIVMMWETYVGQERLGVRQALGSPLTAIGSERLVLGSAAFRRYFGDARKFSDWYTPAAKIIALAQHLEGQENLRIDPPQASYRYERTRLPHISLHLADYFFELSEEGMYSNMLGARVRPRRAAGDASIDEICIRPLNTNHPLAVALTECEDTPQVCLYAANVALRGVHNGMLRNDELRIAPGRRHRVDRDATVVSAIHLLEKHRSLRAIYDLLVPGILKAADFRKEFGNPFRLIRSPRDETVERWRMSLFNLAT